MIDLNKYIDLWKRVLQQPRSTFKSEMKRASWEEFGRNMVIAGLISGLITGIFVGAGISRSQYGAFTGITAFVASLVLSPIISVLATLISSAIFYVIALLLGGKGNFLHQSYLFAIFSAPLGIITSVLFLIPIVGMVAAVVLAIYSLYLSTLSLKLVHRFSTGKAVMTWLIPIIIAMLLGLVAAAALVGILGQYGTGLTV